MGVPRLQGEGRVGKRLAPDDAIAALEEQVEVLRAQLARRKLMTTSPENPTLADLEVVVMPNGEILCAGKSIGYLSKLGRFVTERGIQ